MTDAEAAKWIENRLIALEARRVLLAAEGNRHVAAVEACRSELGQIDLRIPALRVELATLEQLIADAAEAAAK